MAKLILLCLHLLCRKFPNEHLPLSCRDLLYTPRKVELIPMGRGFHYHFGLQKGIVEQLEKWNNAIDSFDFYINVVGLPLTKSTGSQFWPILAKMRHDNTGDSKVFTIGCFWAYDKPYDSNVFLRALVDEMKEVLNLGISFRGLKVNVRKTGFHL